MKLAAENSVDPTMSATSVNARNCCLSMGVGRSAGN